MKKNLALISLFFLLVGSTLFFLFTTNTILNDKHRLDEENAQYKKYFSEIEIWKKCVLGAKLYEIDNEQVIKLADLKLCENE